MYISAHGLDFISPTQKLKRIKNEKCPSPRKKHDLHLQTNLQKPVGYSIAHMHCQLRFLAHITHDDT